MKIHRKFDHLLHKKFFNAVTLILFLKLYTIFTNTNNWKTNLVAQKYLYTSSFVGLFVSFEIFIFDIAAPAQRNQITMQTPCLTHRRYIETQNKIF